jgi:hypothetical protein
MTNLSVPQLVTAMAIIFVWSLFPLPSFASHHTTVPIVILNADGAERSRFDVPLNNWVGGLNVAMADLGEDGTPEILIANGVGNEPRVRVMREDGSEIGSFLAYDPAMGVGIDLAACDLNGDGINEIVTAPEKGGGPHVRIFSNTGEALHPGFFAYAESFRGGVHLACGDLNGDERADLVTLPQAGGGPHVRVWKYQDGTVSLAHEFFAFEESDRRGLVGLVSHRTLTLASSKGIQTDLVTYSFVSEPKVIHTQSWTDEGTATGAVGLLARENALMLVIEGSRHLVELASPSFITTIVETGSPRAASGDFDHDGVDEIVVAPGKPMYRTNEEEQSIIVDLSEQQLYAYERGALAHTFPVSAARAPWKTPVGIHSVLAKLPFVDYTWNYGVDNPNNYSLGLVPWNLRIYPHVYIHYAYWHNNFGHPMSHGCVNVALDHMTWIYDWAEVGTPVEVRE